MPLADKPWMHCWNTYENNATFVVNQCEDCFAFWYEDIRLALRPVCILNDYQPTQCGVKFGMTNPIMHLPFSDDLPSPKIYDARQVFNQVFSDPTGDPNTDAHSVAGHILRALAFDGVDDYVELSSASTVPWIGDFLDFSIAFWWRNTGGYTTTFKRVLSNAWTGHPSITISTRYSDVYYTANFYQGAVEHAISGTFPAGFEGNWHHYAIVRAANTITWYQDGVFVADDTHPYNCNTADSGRLLTCGRDAGAATRYCAGEQEDVRLYNRGLSAAEVAALAAM